jgi:hypothetical protein
VEKNEEYWNKVEVKANELESDGCSVVLDINVECCNEHDIAYRTGKDVEGNPKSRTQADEDFKECNQKRSYFRKLSPFSWWTWIGVRLFGGKSYQGL